MSEVAEQIMDAAGHRIRQGGFNGFSFREVATDVGIKSSSVHYHFPTKENLAAAVVRRYADYVVRTVDEGMEAEANPAKVWTKAFRSTLNSPDRMCPCIVLGASAGDLPAEVGIEVQRFFKMCLDKLTKQGMPSKEAAELLATITGAMVIANAIGDKAAYDRATGERLKTLVPAKPARPAKPAVRTPR